MSLNHKYNIIYDKNMRIVGIKPVSITIGWQVDITQECPYTLCSYAPAINSIKFKSICDNLGYARTGSEDILNKIYILDSIT